MLVHADDYTVAMPNFQEKYSRSQVLGAYLFTRRGAFVADGDKPMLPRFPFQSQRTHSPATKRKAFHSRHRATHNALRSNRERCIEILKRLDASRDTNLFFNKALILLTRYWAETPWSGRAKLLQTADWLIRIGASECQVGHPNLSHTGGEVLCATPHRLTHLS
jgi:hypothetical protein